MSTADKFQKYLTNIADSIRTKEGSTEKIKPIDFPERIEGLEVGGGTSESNIEYLDVSGGDYMLIDALGAGFVEMKISVANAPIPIEGVIGSGLYMVALLSELQSMGATTNIIAAAFDRDAITSVKQDGAVTTQTAYETLVSKGEAYVEAYNNLPRITKEQFYDLSN